MVTQLVTSFWRAITHTKALDHSSGDMETVFFETVYRVTYVAGMSNSDHSFLYKLYSNTVKLLIATCILGETLYAISFSTSLDIVIEQMSVIIIQVMALFRYRYMRMREDVYKKLSTSMQMSNLDMPTPARKALVVFWVQRSETYLKLLLGLGILTLAAWFVYPLLDDIDYNLPIGLTLGVNYSTPERYPFVYVIHITAFYYTSFFVMVNDVIMQAHLINLICQYTVLADCFENIVVDCGKEFKGLSTDQLVRDNRFREVYISRLGVLVEQHKQLLMHTMELRKTISPPMLGQVAASGMQICFAGYQVAMTLTVSFTKFFMSLLFLGYNLFELFVVCRWCDEIKIQSENIREAIYCSGWECGVATMKGVRARLVLVATRASKPVVFTAGGITDLSLNSYCISFQDREGAIKRLVHMGQRRWRTEEALSRASIYYQVGNVGKYLSQNKYSTSTVGKYLFYGNVKSKDEGVHLTLNFSNRPPARVGSITDLEDGTSSYYVHKTEDLTKQERQNIYKKILIHYWNKGYRNKRAASDTVN